MTVESLERLCRQCNGVGVVADQTKPLDPRASCPCSACHGHGQEPTDDGRLLLEFIRRHLKP